MHLNFYPVDDSRHFCFDEQSYEHESRRSIDQKVAPDCHDPTFLCTDPVLYKYKIPRDNHLQSDSLYSSKDISQARPQINRSKQSHDLTNLMPCQNLKIDNHSQDQDESYQAYRNSETAPKIPITTKFSEPEGSFHQQTLRATSFDPCSHHHRQHPTCSPASEQPFELPTQPTPIPKSRCDCDDGNSPFSPRSDAATYGSATTRPHSFIGDAAYVPWDISRLYEHLFSTTLTLHNAERDLRELRSVVHDLEQESQYHKHVIDKLQQERYFLQGELASLEHRLTGWRLTQSFSLPPLVNDSNTIVAGIASTEPNRIYHTQRNTHSNANNDKKNNNPSSQQPPIYHPSIPPFLHGIIPHTHTPHPPIHDPKTGEHRCIIGFPEGKILHPEDKYYRQFLCDKHGNKENFRISMEAMPGWFKKRDPLLWMLKCA